jgi:hypothetical protein
MQFFVLTRHVVVPLNAKATFEHRDLDGFAVIGCDWFKVTPRGDQGCTSGTSGCLRKECSAVHGCILQASAYLVKNRLRTDAAVDANDYSAHVSTNRLFGKPGAAG